MIVTDGRCKKVTTCFQDSFYLANRLWSIRDMIQHMIGNDRIERLIFEWDFLRIDFFKLVVASSDNQISPR